MKTTDEVRALVDSIPVLKSTMRGNGEASNFRIEDEPEYGADPLPVALAEDTSLNWLVEGMIETGSLALLIGPEGSFKSFVGIDIGMSVSHGLDFHGRRTVKGAVLYVAGKGRKGVIRRMRGWLIRRRMDPTQDMFVGRNALAMMDITSVQGVRNFIRKQIKAGRTWALVVIDTVARNFGGGNESSTEDMGRVIYHVDVELRQPTGTAILAVHHSPLESRATGITRSRGSTALPGAADAVFIVEYDGAKIITVSNTKQKDADPCEQLHLTFDVVELGTADNFGNPVTTCVLRRTDERPQRSRGKLGTDQIAVLDLLDKTEEVSMRALVDKAKAAGVTRQNVYRAAKRLAELGFVRIENGAVRML